MSDGGQLQWFYHGSDRFGLPWYMDENSDSDALHLALGKVSYDFRYTSSSRRPHVFTQVMPSAAVKEVMMCKDRLLVDHPRGHEDPSVA